MTVKAAGKKKASTAAPSAANAAGSVPGEERARESTYLVYRFDDYKDALKERVKYLRIGRPALTMKYLATKVSIQSTYLSRCLNEERSHLGEDQLYALCGWLEFLPDEADYVLLLRSHQTSQESARRAALFAKIDSIRKARLISAEHQALELESLQEEIKYLFSPLCILTHVALFIRRFKENPRLLCAQLGISTEQLKEILVILHSRDYIVISDADPFLIKEVKSKNPHFGREHILMRAHQSTLKSIVHSRLNQTAEDAKESMLFTFTMDEQGFTRVREATKEFINQVQKIAYASDQKHVYQLSLDFLKWL
jgi:hypothetical protein